MQATNELLQRVAYANPLTEGFQPGDARYVRRYDDLHSVGLTANK